MPHVEYSRNQSTAPRPYLRERERERYAIKNQKQIEFGVGHAPPLDVLPRALTSIRGEVCSEDTGAITCADFSFRQLSLKFKSALRLKVLASHTLRRPVSSAESWSPAGGPTQNNITYIIIMARIDHARAHMILRACCCLADVNAWHTQTCLSDHLVASLSQIPDAEKNVKLNYKLSYVDRMTLYSLFICGDSASNLTKL